MRPRRMAKLRSVETKIVKDVEGEMMMTLRRPRGMAKLRSVETRMDKDVEEEMMNRPRKMISHQLPLQG